jgi:signal transduction histidine kinase
VFPEHHTAARHDAGEEPAGTRPSARELPRAPFWMRRPRMLEVSTPVVIVGALAAGAATLPFHDHPAGGLVALLISAAGVVAGYRVPLVGLALLAAAPLVADTLGADPIVQWQVSMFGAFLLALRGLSGLLTGLVIGAADFLALGLSAGSFGLSDPIAYIAGASALAAAATGSAIRGQQQYWSALQQTTHEAVAGRDAAVQRSVAEERLRIARDLHDTLGHEIAVLGMHLGAAEVQLPDQAGPAREHLTAARSSVQSLLAETQEILRVLRPGRDADTTSPVASHHAIPDLVEAFRTAGMDLDATVGDLSPELPPQTSAAAYRIVQEALTNAQRYGAGTVSLTVDITDRAATIETVNPLSPTAARVAAGSGQGLIGMRERAATAGGHLGITADERSFRVQAVLPVTEGVLR